MTMVDKIALGALVVGWCSGWLAVVLWLYKQWAVIGACQICPWTKPRVKGR